MEAARYYCSYIASAWRFLPFASTMPCLIGDDADARSDPIWDSTCAGFYLFDDPNTLDRVPIALSTSAECCLFPLSLTGGEPSLMLCRLSRCVWLVPRGVTIELDEPRGTVLFGGHTGVGKTLSMFIIRRLTSRVPSGSTSLTLFAKLLVSSASLSMSLAELPTTVSPTPLREGARAGVG